MVGLIPLNAVTTLGPQTLGRLADFAHRMQWYVQNHPDVAAIVDHITQPGTAGYYLLSIAGPDRVRRVLAAAFDPAQFLSPYGLRSLSRALRDQPFEINLGSGAARLDYEPAESRNGLFGGNSNWRGPVWLPLNYLFIAALRRYDRYCGPGFTIEYPTGSGQMRRLAAAADDLSRRLIALFLKDSSGRRPVFGGDDRLEAWRDVLFFEYFNGDTGAGLGASHQTGWTGLVADLIAGRRPRT